jgi:DNA-binding NarL/FixJ family response regulator
MMTAGAIAIERGPYSEDLASSGLIRVLVADGHWLDRIALGSLLASVRGISLAGFAMETDEILTVAARTAPDAIVIDVDLLGDEAVELIRELRANPLSRDAGVLVLTGSDDRQAIIEVLRAGAGGVLHKDTDPDELIRALSLVVSRQALPIMLPKVRR